MPARLQENREAGQRAFSNRLRRAGQRRPQMVLARCHVRFFAREDGGDPFEAQARSP